MSHNIFNERFYSLRKPAWHGLGTVSEEELYAVEAFSSLTPYDVRLEDMVTASGFPVPMRAILRDPVPDDNEIVFFGAVGLDYEALTPQMVCEIYDRVVNQPIETIGALGRGEQFFLTTKMPSTKIIGDRVDHYLLLDAPMFGNQAAHIRQTPVRVVCNNTLIVGRQAAVQSLRVEHNSGVYDRFESWLGETWTLAVNSIELLNSFFKAFAHEPVSVDQVESILFETYPNPNVPRQDAPPSVMARRLEDYAYWQRQAETQRSLAHELFDGAGVGQETKAAKGTAWGLYNAVVELEDFKGAGRGSRNPLARNRDALFGPRASNKERCFEAIVNEFEISL